MNEAEPIVVVDDDSETREAWMAEKLKVLPAW